ncbi:MAG: hypothetical protein K0Q50_927 [Vampirovibrio sp.]|jgi:hypothetical protein|nr:hypothetical protein [Vampirovibrio sp.]
MSDDISNKVINIFQRHKRGEHFHFDVEEGGELIISPDGFNYVSIKHDSNATAEESTLRDTADIKHYIIKMVEAHHENGSIRMNNYYVPGERLEEFLRSLPQRPGKVLEIQQFIPDNMA